MLPDFTDPQVPLGHSKWKRASECSKEKLAEVVAFLEKNVEADNKRMEDFNKLVLAGAKAQLAKK